MSITIKAKNIGDVIAAVPVMCGYTPVQSLVGMIHRGGTLNGLFRYDLPSADASDETLDQLAVSLLGNVLRIKDAEGVLAIIYSDEEHTAHTRLAQRLMEYPALVGLAAEAAFVAGDGWGLFGQAPSSFLELPNLDMPEAEAAYGHQGSGTEITRMDPAREYEILSVVRTVNDEIAERVVEIAEAAVSADLAGLSATALAEVATLACLPMYRDVILATWCHGADAGRDALAFQKAFQAGEPITAPGTTFLAGQGERPNVTNLRRGLILMRHLAGSDAFDASALTVAAWISWALGQGTHASIYAKNALALQPIGLAQIIDELTQRGEIPEWAFRS